MQDIFTNEELTLDNMNVLGRLTRGNMGPKFVALDSEAIYFTRQLIYRLSKITY
jgi:hypothetical protein